MENFGFGVFYLLEEDFIELTKQNDQDNIENNKEYKEERNERIKINLKDNHEINLSFPSFPSSSSSSINSIGNKNNLYSYPYHENSLSLLKLLISLQKNNHIFLIEFSTHNYERMRYFIVTISLYSTQIGKSFNLPKNSENILNWISNSWKDFQFPILHQKCQQKLEKTLLYDVYMRIPSHENFSPISSQSTTTTTTTLITNNNSITNPHHNYSTLIELPKEMLFYIFSYLNAPSLASISCCNKYLKQTTKLIIPGLYLKLFPHQETSVKWMLLQENPLPQNNLQLFNTVNEQKNQELLLHRVFYFQNSNSSNNIMISSNDNYSNSNININTNTNENENKVLGECLYYSISQKQLIHLESYQNNQFQRGVRGGMLCDEPGLGKTITMLAVILKTIGAVTATQIENGNNSSPYLSQRMTLRSPSATSKRKLLTQSNTIPSRTTLIVTPDSLIHHWRDQINQHINPSLKLKIYLDDDFNKSIPSANEIVKYDIFLTCFRRLSIEWTRGKPPSLLNEVKKRTYEDEYQSNNRYSNYISPKRQSISLNNSFLSPITTTTTTTTPTTTTTTTPTTSVESSNPLSELLKINWFRIVIDEGHQLGRSSTTNTIQMASLLEAERRWILTGTPTKSYSNQVANAALRHLFQMLKFIRYVPLYSDDSEVLWKKYISRPMERNIPSILAPTESGYYILSKILSQIMIRHSKENMKNIPKPTWKKTLLEMNTTEKSSYNAIVALAKSNLVTTGNDYHLPGEKHLDSLLNPRNRKFLTETLANIRVACCGGGHAQLQLINFEFNRSECLNMLRNNTPDISHEIISKVNKFINSTVEGKTSICELCGLKLVCLLVAPCGHLYCPDCLGEMKDYCKLCDIGFNWNFLQRLQPGFEAKDYFFPPPNPNMEMNSTMLSDDLLFAESSTKARYLIEQIRLMEKEFEVRSEKYKTYMLTRPEWSNTIKNNLIIPKIIVFSQFFEFLDRMAIDLTLAKIKYVTFHGKNKLKELHRFQYIPDIRVLFLSKDGSHGLDLSYVTHIFLMDTVLDNSLLQQVVSRAYRMGCRQSVIVNQLIMKGTIEEIIYKCGSYGQLTEGNIQYKNSIKEVKEVKEVKEGETEHEEGEQEGGEEERKYDSNTQNDYDENKSEAINQFNQSKDNGSNLPLMHFLVKKLELLRS